MLIWKNEEADAPVVSAPEPKKKQKAAPKDYVVLPDADPAKAVKK